MAIIDYFHVSVSVKDRDLNEYVYDENETEASTAQTPSESKSVRRYVEAIEGEEFVINYRSTAGYLLPSGANSIVWKLAIDGNYMIGETSGKTKATRLGATNSSFSGAIYHEGASHRQRNFKFKPMENTSEKFDENLRTLKKYRTKGTIRVQVWPYFEKAGNVDSYWPGADEDLSLPEKAVKGRAVTVGVGYGTDRSIPFMQFCAGHKIGVEPIATFIFEYRTREALKQLMVIARTPSPKPEVPLAERDPDSLTTQETRQLLDELKAYKNAQEKMKAALKEELMESKTGIKREHPTDENGVRIVATKKSKLSSEKPVIVLD